MGRPTSRFDWLITTVVFAIPLSYCVVGALRGRLFIPHHRSYGQDVILSGFAAWAVVAALVMLWLGVSIRIGLFPDFSPRIRVVFEMTLLVAGVAMLVASGRLPTVTPA